MHLPRCTSYIQAPQEVAGNKVMESMGLVKSGAEVQYVLIQCQSYRILVAGGGDGERWGPPVLGMGVVTVAVVSGRVGWGVERAVSGREDGARVSLHT